MNWNIISELSPSDAKYVFNTLLASRAYRTGFDSRGVKFDKRACRGQHTEQASIAYTKIYEFWRDNGFKYSWLRFALHFLRNAIAGEYQD